MGPGAPAPLQEPSSDLSVFSQVEPGWASLGSIIINAAPGTAPGFYFPAHLPPLSIFSMYSGEQAPCPGLSTECAGRLRPKGYSGLSPDHSCLPHLGSTPTVMTASQWPCTVIHFTDEETEAGSG